MSMARPRPVSPREPTLDLLLAEAATHAVEFPEALANHLPMILVALDRLGASGAQLATFFAHYRDTKGLVPTPPARSPLAWEGWTDALGDRSREADYRAFFVTETTRLGCRGMLAAALPVLAPGVAASALHPLMRLAYGVLRSDPVEVGTALAYWAACYLPLPRATGAPPITDDPAAILERVNAMPGLRRLPAYDHLWHGLEATGADPDFAPLVDWLRVDAATLSRVAGTALALYAATGDFAALHAVTGAHWVRLVTSACPSPPLLRYFWQSVAALVPAIGFPALPTPAQLDGWRRQPCPDWPSIKAAAAASPDEHDISLVFSAAEEEKVYGDPLYRVVAARRVGLIG